MTPEQFCYWLQGFSELSAISPTQEQWVLIQEHLNLVFKKVTPSLNYLPQPHIPFKELNSQAMC